MKQKSKLSKVAKVATGTAFLLFCLLNLKIVTNNNENVGKTDSNVALAAYQYCDHDPVNDWGNCMFFSKVGYICVWTHYNWHDCDYPYNSR